jgi:signal transduction histidine kinase
LTGIVVMTVISNWRSEAEYESLRHQKAELERLQAEFVQNVNHELRHPLTMLWGYVEMLAKNQLDKNARSQLSSVVLAQTISLVERVEAITAFQDVPGEQMRTDVVDLGELTETASKMVWQKARRARVSVNVDCGPESSMVVGDPAWLLEALKQLLDNAIKFSPEGGTVRVRVCHAKDEVCVEVADEGIGIPADQLGRIFTPFCQGDGSASRRYGGVGLGLAIAQAVARGHSGCVRVASQGHGEGSTFILSLPRPISLRSDRLSPFRRSFSVKGNGKEAISVRHTL